MDAAILYAKENLAVVRVFLRDPYYMLIVRDVRTNFLTIIGSVGGWFGMCCGLSAISIIEMLYHLLLTLVALWKRKAVRNDWEEKEEEKESLNKTIMDHIKFWK